MKLYKIPEAVNQNTDNSGRHHVDLNKKNAAIYRKTLLGEF